MVETRKVLVTGGAGFIGSHLVDGLVARGHEVTVLDNMSGGHREFLDLDAIELIEADLLDAAAIDAAARDAEVLVHSAADPVVGVGADHAGRHFEQNVVTTQNTLEAARKGATEEFLFLSTSTVYGETQVIPTPESLGPLEPISTYGASKAACEAIVSGHAHTFGLNAVSYRFANIIGPRLTHGVIYDFAHKLLKDPTTLEILGDGTQDKSYCHVDDVVSAVLTTLEHPDRPRPVAVYNVGTDDSTTVVRIADLVCEAMGLEGVEYAFTGGVDGGRGWKGDVKRMQLDAGALKGLGWKAAHGSDEAVRVTAAWMAAQLEQ